MADQDFDINIRTTADTRGAEQTNAALKTVYNTVEQNRAKFRELEGLPPLEKKPEKPEAKEETDKLFGHLESGYARLAIHAIGIGAIYEFINEIKKSAEQINKITESLEKQGDVLVKNVQLMAEASKFAQDQADVVKIGEAGLKDVAAQHANVVELQKQELSYWQQFIDSLAKGGQIGIGPLQKALDDAVETAQRFEEEARRQTYFKELAAQLTIARHEAQSFDQNIQEITAHIREQEAIQARAGPDQVEDYVKAGRAAQAYKKELESLIQVQKQQQAVADAAAKPIAAAVQKTPDEYAKEQAKSEDQHHADRMAKIQKLKEYEATGDTQKAKALDEELRHDTFNQGQRKEALQRYSALQEDLMQREGGSPTALGVLGTGGATRKRYESAQSELADIYAREKSERDKLLGEAPQQLQQPQQLQGKPAGGGSPDVVAAIQKLIDLWK